MHAALWHAALAADGSVEARTPAWACSWLGRILATCTCEGSMHARGPGMLPCQQMLLGGGELGANCSCSNSMH